MESGDMGLSESLGMSFFVGYHRRTRSHLHFENQEQG